MASALPGGTGKARTPFRGSSLFDLRNRTVSFSRGADALYNIKVDAPTTDAPVDQVMQAVFREDAGQLADEVASHILSGRFLTICYRVWDDRGAVRWIRAEGQCLYDAHGEPLAFPANLVDVTDTIASGDEVEVLGNLLLSSLHLAWALRRGDLRPHLEAAFEAWAHSKRGRETGIH